MIIEFTNSRWVSITVVMLLLALVPGCGIVQDKDAAESVARSYFEDVRTKQFEEALTLYEPQFFESTPKEKWLQALKNINAKLGDLQSYELEAWKIQATASTSLNGTTFLMQYKVVYSKYSATEKLTLFKPSGSSEIKILGHMIDSEGFLQ